MRRVQPAFHVRATPAATAAGHAIVRRPIWARVVLPCLFVALVRPCADAGQPATRPATTRPAGITFMGIPSDAKSVVFVCDASASMVEKKSTIREQLAATLAGMASDDVFDVIFMQQPDAADFSNELVHATDATAEKLAQFCRDVEMSRVTIPLPAIELGFAKHPAAIYLVTDGDFPDNNAVLAAVRRLNADGKVSVNTIAVVGEEDYDTNYHKLLQTLATENHGTCRTVKIKDLRK